MKSAIRRRVTHGRAQSRIATIPIASSSAPQAAHAGAAPQNYNGIGGLGRRLACSPSMAASTEPVSPCAAAPGIHQALAPTKYS